MVDLVRSSATSSWIDERLFNPITLPEVDWGSQLRYTNNESVGRNLLVGQEAYRFANFLEASVTVRNSRIVSSGFTPASNLYRSPSFFDIESEAFGVRRSKVVSDEAVTFKQLVGCRTQSPEAIAEVVGAGAGFVVGVGGGIIVAGLGGWVGHRIGREAVEEFMVFPPIWTEIALTIYATGRTDCELTRHSLFPSLCLYSQRRDRQDRYHREHIYDARLIMDRWKQRGWGNGNPWHIPDPQGWGDNRRHASLTQGSRSGSTNRNGPVRGSIASSNGSVLGGSTIPGPTTA